MTATAKIVHKPFGLLGYNLRYFYEKYVDDIGVYNNPISAPIFISTVTNNLKEILPFFCDFFYAAYIILIKSKRKHSIRVLDMFWQPKPNTYHRSCHTSLQFLQRKESELLYTSHDIGVKKKLKNENNFRCRSWTDCTWSSMYFTATMGIVTPCLEATLLSVWRRAWKRLHPPQASTICHT